MNLQYVPQPLDRVGELCGFDGNAHHCHKGLVPVFGIFSFVALLICLTRVIFLPNRVLTRCKWMYNDIKKLVPLVAYFPIFIGIVSYSWLIFLPSEYYYAEIVF